MQAVATRLAVSPEKRIWGTKKLSPWFPDSDEPIGELWFRTDPSHPLLVKLLFTSQALSVQVHPGETYARQHENCRGKTEMWHILNAEPGSAIFLGFIREVTKEEARAAIADGTLCDLLRKYPVKAGETYLARAGTVHAIGAGITLCEIQQNSDITYRLYDYGRQRELHIEQALAVADLKPYDGLTTLPVRCDYFETEAFAMTVPVEYDAHPGELVIILKGEGRIDGRDYSPGQVWQPSRRATIAPSSPTRGLRTWAPEILTHP